MPTINYADWYRQEQERIRQQRGLMQPTALGQGQYGYQPISGSEARQRERGFYTDVGLAAAQGYASGGQAGAILNAAIAAAPGIARAGRESWDAAKAGSVEGVRRSIKPIAPGAVYIEKGLEKVGFPTWASPTRIATKVIKNLFGGSVTDIEKKRWERLKSYGFDVPKPNPGDTKDAGLKGEDKTLAKDFVGYNEQGKWVNNKFANSREEADLKAQDIQDFATNFETFGKPYQVLSPEKRQQMMDIALQNNLVREQKGTVDIAWTPETYRKAQDILMGDKAVQDYLASQPDIYKWGGNYKWNAAKPASSTGARKP